MKYQLLAAGALAPLAAAANINRRDWGDHVQYVTNVEVVTVYDIVTVYVDGPAATADAGSEAASSTAANQPSATAPAIQSSVDATPSSVDSILSSVAAIPSSVDSSSVAGGPITIGSSPVETPSSNRIHSSASVETSSASAAASSQHVDSSSARAAVSTSAASVVANTLVDSHTHNVHTSAAQPTTTLATHVVASSSSSKAEVQATVASSVAPKPQSTGSSSSSSGSAKNITVSSLSPRGKKAGLSGYVGIQQLDAFKDLSPYISWYSDYTANTSSVGDVVGVGMLWAAQGSTCGASVTNRVAGFDNLVSTTTPEIMFGFYEPDCYCPDSSSMTTSQGQAAWNSMIAPLKAKGTVLGSPSMCKQKDETWLTPFKSNIDADWDVTSVHINKPNITGVKQDIEYYASTYGKPIWVSEFACVQDHDTWTPCTDQAQINQFIKDAVEFFQNNDTVVAYGPSNGNGLGDTWPLTTVSGALSESGTTYLNAIKGL